MSSRVRVAWVTGERVFVGAEVRKQLQRQVRDAGVFHVPLVGPMHTDCRVLFNALGAGNGTLMLIREARGTRKSEWKRLKAAWMLPKRTGKQKEAAVPRNGDGVPIPPAEPAQINRAFRVEVRAGRPRRARFVLRPVDEVF